MKKIMIFIFLIPTFTFSRGISEKNLIENYFFLNIKNINQYIYPEKIENRISESKLIQAKNFFINAVRTYFLYKNYKDYNYNLVWIFESDKFIIYCLEDDYASKQTSQKDLFLWKFEYQYDLESIQIKNLSAENFEQYLTRTALSNSILYLFYKIEYRYESGYISYIVDLIFFDKGEYRIFSGGFTEE